MAIKIWWGQSPGNEGNWDYDDAGGGYANSNWRDEDGNGVAKPASGDIVIFRSGSQSVTAGLSQASVSLAGLRIDAQYSGQVGSATAPLQIGVDYTTSAGLQVYGSTGFYHSGIVAGSVIVAAPARTIPIHVGEVASTADPVLLARGTIAVKRGANFSPQISFLSVQAYDVTATFSSTVTSIAEGKQDGGVVTLNLSPDNWTISEGQVEQTTGDLPSGTIKMYGGQYSYSANPAGGSLRLEAFGGTFDASRCAGSFVLSSVDLHPEAAVYLNNGTKSITGRINDYGGTLVLDVGTEIEIL